MVATAHQQELIAQYEEIKRAIGVGNSSFAIVNRLLASNRSEMAVDDTVDILSDREYSSDEKLRFLLDFRNMAGRIETLCELLETSTDEAVCLEVLTTFAAMLSIQEVFKTPNERRGCAQEIVGLFELIVNKNLPPSFIKFISPSIPMNLQIVAAQCLAHIALGVRIASMPLDNLLHPTHSLFRRALIAAGAVEPLVHLANTAGDGDAKEAALHALAAIAFGSIECRDYVLKTIIREQPTYQMGWFQNQMTTPLAFDTTLLRQAELNELVQRAGIGAAELEQLFQMWGGSLDARVTREQFAAGLQRVGVTDPLVIEQSFSAFDVDKSGSIDFREFVAGMAILNRGSPEDRLRLMFRSYDLDGSGYLEPDEVYALYRTALLASGLPRTAPELEHQTLTNMVEECFRRVDVDGDRRLNFAEFVNAVQNNVIINRCFVQTPFST